MHLGILLVINFTDLSLGVLMIHAFTAPTVWCGFHHLDVCEGFSMLGDHSQVSFRFFLCAFSTYLTVHFYQLLPYAPALWSSEGMLPNPLQLPTASFPSPLTSALTTPTQLQAFVAILTGCAGVIALLATVCTRRMWEALSPIRSCLCLLLWYGWACLWNRNIFISNPGLPYVGWLLLASALWPSGQSPWEEEERGKGDEGQGGHAGSKVVKKNNKRKRRRKSRIRMLLSYLLVGVGAAAMLGYALDLPTLKQAGLATVASPLPLVFSAFKGHETFSNAFYFTALDQQGKVHVCVCVFAFVFLCTCESVCESAYVHCFAVSPEYVIATSAGL